MSCLKRIGLYKSKQRANCNASDMGASHSDSDPASVGVTEVTEMSEAVCVSVLQLQVSGRADGIIIISRDKGIKARSEAGAGHFFAPALPVQQLGQGQLPPLPRGSVASKGAYNIYIAAATLNYASVVIKYINHVVIILVVAAGRV